MGNREIFSMSKKDQKDKFSCNGPYLLNFYEMETQVQIQVEDSFTAHTYSIFSFLQREGIHAGPQKNPESWSDAGTEPQIWPVASFDDKKPLWTTNSALFSISYIFIPRNCTIWITGVAIGCQPFSQSQLVSALFLPLGTSSGTTWNLILH